MATVGQTSTPGSALWWTGINLDNEVASSFVMPQTGLLTQAHAYLAGHGGSVTARLVIWDNSGNILWQSNSFSAANGSGGVGGQAWYTQTISPSLLVLGGATIFIGWWRDAGGAAEWSITGSGDFQVKTNTSGSPGSFSGHGGLGSPDGTLGAYADYTPVTLYAYDGAAWQAATLDAFDGTTQQPVSLYAFDGTAWQQIG